MHDLTYAGTILAQSREKLYAAQAPRFIAQRELELLQAAARTPRQPRYSVRRVLARVSTRLAGTGDPRVATS